MLIVKSSFIDEIAIAIIGNGAEVTTQGLSRNIVRGWRTGTVQNAKMIDESRQKAVWLS
jgi:hypothetical protein